MNIAGRVLTVLLGAAPATFLSLTAALGVVLGLGGMVDGELGGLIFVVWGGSGIYGTLSLWAVGLGFVRPWVVVGVIFGTAALMPIAMMSLQGLGSSIFYHPETLATIGPIVVAIAWMGVWVVGGFRRRALMT